MYKTKIGIYPSTAYANILKKDKHLYIFLNIV